MKLSVFSLSLLALLTPLAAAWSKEGKYIPADTGNPLPAMTKT